MAVSNEEILWCYRNLLAREPESEEAVRTHVGNRNFKKLVEGFVTSTEFAGKRLPAAQPPAKPIGVSKDEILWCYRKLLGREPESEAVVRAYLGMKGFKEVVADFVDSAEFKQKRQPAVQSLGKSERFYPSTLPKIEVDTIATKEQLAAATAKIKATWAHLGIVKPHFSVLTDEQFLPTNLAGSIDKFWRSGEDEAETVRRMLERHGFSGYSGKVCVEYGCGVGRVTMGFAPLFAQVHGYDISPGHLECAKQRAQEINVTNTRFHQCSEDPLADLQECDFFYSRIVFQHNPPPIICELIKKALRALRPGGTAIFQVPTYGFKYRFNFAEWLKTEHALDMQMHCLPQQVVFELIADEGCVPLEVKEDNSTGAPDKYISNTFVVRKRS
jgi:SAM-dependent methyltransferase